MPNSHFQLLLPIEIMKYNELGILRLPIADCLICSIIYRSQNEFLYRIKKSLDLPLAYFHREAGEMST